jgi:hypothetical protein
MALGSVHWIPETEAEHSFPSSTKAEICSAYSQCPLCPLHAVVLRHGLVKE